MIKNEFIYSEMDKPSPNKIILIKELILCLYELDGCQYGGIAHNITNCHKYDDDSIDSVILECEKEENKDLQERGLVYLICTELKKLSIGDRISVFK